MPDTPRSTRPPARKQVDRPVPADPSSDFLSPEEFWKLRKAPKTLRGYRCDPDKDAGATLATTHSTTRLRCVFFARGTCHRGAGCHYVHEVPDEGFFAYAKTQPQFDCFGRQRSGEDLTNCNDCTTLFLWLGGVLVNHASSSAEAIEGLIRADFAVFGPIAFVNVIVNKTIAFVRYRYRSSAEFAKEAMTRQCLKGDPSGTVLDVRWANEDPNPKAKARVKREREERFVKAVEGKEGGEEREEREEGDEDDDWRRYVSSGDEEEEGDDGGDDGDDDDDGGDDDDDDGGDDDDDDGGDGGDDGEEKGRQESKSALFAAYGSDSD